MKTILLTLIAFKSLSAFSEPSKVFAVISEIQEENRTSYKISITNKESSQRILMVSYGESCSLGKQIDQERFGFDQVPILDNKGIYKPNMAQSNDTFEVDTDNYLKLSSIDARSGDEKLPFIDQNSTKEVVFYTTKKSNNLMFDLPICVEAGGGEHTPDFLPERN